MKITDLLKGLSLITAVSAFALPAYTSDTGAEDAAAAAAAAAAVNPIVNFDVVDNLAKITLADLQGDPTILAAGEVILEDGDFMGLVYVRMSAAEAAAAELEDPIATKGHGRVFGYLSSKYVRGARVEEGNDDSTYPEIYDHEKGVLDRSGYGADWEVGSSPVKVEAGQKKQDVAYTGVNLRCSILTAFTNPDLDGETLQGAMGRSFIAPFKKVFEDVRGKEAEVRVSVAAAAKAVLEAAFAAEDEAAAEAADGKEEEGSAAAAAEAAVGGDDDVQEDEDAASDGQ